MYFASAVAAIHRGYHCLLFDGPGQGELLIEQGIPIRPDWGTVVSAVIDVAVTLPLVDPTRIVISGWSLGGYLRHGLRRAKIGLQPALPIRDYLAWRIVFAGRPSMRSPITGSCAGASSSGASGLIVLMTFGRIWPHWNSTR